MGIIGRFLSLGISRMYKDAMKYYNQCMYKEAIEKFELILHQTRKPGALHIKLSKFYCGQAHCYLGEIYFAVGKYAQAVKEFQAALAFMPNSIELYHYLGLCFCNLDNQRQAYDAFTRVMQQDPDRLAPKSKLAVLFHTLGIWDKAEVYFRNSIKKNTGFADHYFLLGITMLGNGKTAEAVAVFQKALTINPQYKDAGVKSGVLLAFQKKFEEALLHLLPVMEAHPSHADNHYYLGLLYSSMQAVDKGIACFRNALKINSGYKDARVKLGVVLLKNNNVSDGLDELEAAYALDPSDKALKAAVKTLRNVQETEKLKNQERETFRPAAENTGPHIMHDAELINYAVIGPDFKDMIAVLKAMPQDGAVVYEYLIPILKETVALHPEYSDIHNSLGAFYLKTGQYEKAIESFQDARKIKPDYIKARLNLFNVLKEQADFESAMAEGLALVSEGLPYPDLMCALGEVYMSMGKHEDALKIVAMVPEKNPQFAPAYFLMSQIYIKLGDSAKASEILKKIV